MSVIGVERPADDPRAGLSLHSCPACGRHSWRTGGREVDRSELLDALRVVREPRPARRPVAVPDDRPADAGEPDRRADLQRLLSGFRVHGSTS